MTEIHSTLTNVTDLDREVATSLADQLNEVLVVPERWTTVHVDVEESIGTPGEWKLLDFEDDEQNVASIFVLPGSHSLQLYTEANGYQEPTTYASEIETQLLGLTVEDN